MTDTQPRADAPSQSQRWATYGLNTAVLIIAVLAIVLFVNWISYRHFIRFDQTATRRYSLSQQSGKVISQLEQEDTTVELVSLFAYGTELGDMLIEQLDQVSQLLTEFERRSGGRINVKQINPVFDAGEYEAFADQLLSRYEQELTPWRQAITEAQTTLAAVQSFATEQSQQFELNRPRFGDLAPADQQLLANVGQLLGNLDTTLALDQYQSELTRVLGAPLPNYSRAKQLLSDPMRQLRDQLLNPAVERFEQLIEGDQAPQALADFLRSRIQAIRPMIQRIDDALEQLEALEEGEYATVRRNVQTTHSIVAMGNDRVAVLTLDQIFPQSTATQPGQAQPVQRFRGEEAITGAIVRLMTEHMPKVVFVNTMPQSVLSPGGEYSMSQVAGVLEAMNFEVVEWNAAGRRSQFGMMPPEPAPEAAPGQTMVFVVLPILPSGNPQMPTNPAATTVAEALGDHLAAGQPALTLIMPSPMAGFGPPDPVVELVSEYGITPDTGSLVFRSETLPNGQTQAMPYLEITQWPDEHPIAEALAGQVAMLIQAMPLELADDQPDTGDGEGDQGESGPAARTYRLATTPADTWAEAGWANRQAEPEQDPDESTGPFVVAAAAEKQDTRLVVFGDILIPTDMLTQPRMTTDGRQIQFVRYAGNTELFVNSVYWLSGMDSLIATGARTQDIPRYQPITQAAQIGVGITLILGVPLACLIAGVAVWVIRRK
jgi:hypothetical protein